MGLHIDKLKPRNIAMVVPASFWEGIFTNTAS